MIRAVLNRSFQNGFRMTDQRSPLVNQLLLFTHFSLNERLSEYASGHANIMNRLDQLEQEKEDIARIKEERDEIIAEKEELEATIEKLNFEKQISRQDKMYS